PRHPKLRIVRPQRDGSLEGLVRACQQQVNRKPIRIHVPIVRQRAEDRDEVIGRLDGAFLVQSNSAAVQAGQGDVGVLSQGGIDVYSRFLHVAQQEEQVPARRV